jgi:hypothetical protein
MPDDNPYRESEQHDQAQYQASMFARYHPQAGRADRSASNIPGDKTTIGSMAGHFIGHGGSN